MKKSFRKSSGMMLHSLFAVLIVGCLPLVIVSCSDSNESEVTSVAPAKRLSFTVVPWGGDANGNTRAVGGNTKNIGTVNVGSNISGYVNMHSEKPAATTRATEGTSPVADDRYTIVAYLKNTNGTYTKSRTLDVIGKGGIFTTTDGKEARFSNLPDGTYRLMCYNKYFTLSEDGNTLSLTNDADAAANALVGYSDDVVVTNNTTDVSFVLQHPYARFKIRLAGTDMTLGGRTGSNVVPTYDRVFTSTTEHSNVSFVNSDGYAGTLAVRGGGMDVKPFNSSTTSTTSSATATDKGTFTFSAPQVKSTFDKGTNVALDVPGYANSSYYQASEQTAYCYVPAGLSPKAVTLKIADAGTTVNGTVYKDSLYGEPLSGTPITLSANTPDASMQAGHSYIFTVNLSYNYNYVFNDYSVGTLADNPNKTPIALVTSSKTKTAMALHNAVYNGTGTNSATMLWNTGGVSDQLNTNIYGWNQFFTASHGWHETYLASYTKDGTTVKATSTNYPAFYAAAHYNPSAPSAPVQSITVPSDATDSTKRWYLPSYGDFNLLYRGIGGGKYYGYPTSSATTVSDGTPWKTINWRYPWNGCRAVIAVEQAGGDKLTRSYWISTQSNYTNNNQSSTSYYPVGKITIYTNGQGNSYNAIFTTDQSLAPTTSTATPTPNSVRPFIHY
jgi:hypothetical protein